MNQEPITRRQFIAAASAASVGLTFHAAGASADSSEAYPIGCYTRPFDQHEYRVALDAVAEAGYKYAGIMTAKGASWVVVSPKTAIEEARQIGAEVTKRGLKTISVYGDFSVAQSLEQGVGDLRRLVDNCAACGSPNLLLGGTTDPKLYENYVKAIKESVDYAQSAKVALSIKPHGGMNATGLQCRKMIEQVGHRNFGLWYDPGNIFYYSDGALNPVDDCGSVGDLVVGMSVKDFKRPKEVLVNPGDGEVDFRTVISKLRQGGFTRGPLVVECLARADLKASVIAASKTRLLLEELIGRK